MTTRIEWPDRGVVRQQRVRDRGVLTLAARPAPAVAVWAVGWLLAASLLVATPPPVLAECTSVSPWPSFREAAPSATTILIGTVTWTPGGEVNNHFILHVDEVLRGNAPEAIEFRAFRSGAPQPVCPEDSSLIVRRVGERLAFAYGAHLAGLRREITAVAFVRPSRPDPFLLPEMERLSVAEVRAIAAAPPATDATPRKSSRPSETDLAVVVAWFAGCAAFFVVVLDRRRRRA